ncbi:MAG: exodeoxyribonuclease VII large subunit [Oscillospiraceae bacterium]|nr:exodeoxyribonuclease VII large subunit [Oscillospiraceae bacterium]
MNIYTVTQVNMYIKALLDEVQLVQSIYISGEISNFKHYYQSGHMYFTIKDEKSQLKCVMFSSDNSRLRFEPQNGMKVICFGKLGVYERDGVYQLYVRDMQPKGTGELQIAFEQLKQKLEAEGLFDERHKKPIPKYPEKIGIASSNMGAAKEDMKSVISRRFPLCEVISLHTIVQGENAPADIADSICRLDKMGVDTIIVGRGGGSIEELWAFNTEEVARAVFECNTPIISAVGHETDYTICDFVADLRAPTPSAAAELAVPDITSERMNINNFEITLESLINNIIVSKKAELDALIKNSALMDSDKFFDNISAKLNEYDYKMKTAVSSVVTKKESRLLQLASMINALSPLAVMSRGYAIVSKDKNTVDSANLLKKGETIQIDFSDGEVNAVVSEVKKYE